MRFWNLLLAAVLVIGGTGAGHFRRAGHGAGFSAAAAFAISGSVWDAVGDADRQYSRQRS